MAINQTTAQSGMNLSEWLVALKRRSALMALIFSAIVLVTLVIAFVWPAKYTSTGTILIEQQELPSDLVRSTITSYADQRIQVISQRVMTTDNLFKIIQKFDLYPADRKNKTREYVLAEMKDDVEFKMISANVLDPRTGVPAKATIAFTVSYSNRSPALAAKVANELVSLYLQQNIDTRKERTADATSFLADESKRLDKDITTQQAELEKFKQQHLNDLPEKAQLNVQMMDRTDQELRDLETRVNSLDQQLVYLDSQLAQISPTSQVYTSTGERVLSPTDRLKYLRTELARLTGTYGPDHPDVKRMQREVAGLEATVSDKDAGNDLQRQLDNARTQLAAARQKYSADHPDVVKLQRQISSLQDQLQSVNASADSKAVQASNPDNPAYIQIKAQREGAISEKTSLMQKRAELKAQIADFEKRIASGPSVEREYTTMLRDLESLQLKYRDVHQKQLEAEVSQNLESERKGERFTLIEPPLTPEAPTSPNRIVIIVLGIMLSIASAVGTVILLETLDTSVRNRRDLELLLSVPPLAILPWIETDAEKQQQAQHRRRLLIGSAVGLIVMLTLVHFLYRPLDLLWQLAVRRLTG